MSIAELRVGDLVLSRDLKTQRTLVRPLERIIRKSARELFAIHTAAGVIDGVTASHPVWLVDEARYTKVGELRVGQRMLSRAGEAIAEA